MEAFCHKCKAWIPSTSIKVEGISANEKGQDVISFICPECNTQQLGVVRTDG